MASAAASRVMTIARLIGDITDKGTTFEESLVLTDKMTLDTNPLPKPIVKFCFYRNSIGKRVESVRKSIESLNVTAGLGFNGIRGVGVVG
jgi:hypothetical protein